MESSTKTPAAPETNTPATTPRDGAASARALTIDGMTCDACVKKVQDALQGVLGVTMHHVKIGTARITADQSGCDAACKAVEAAGFKCHDKNTDAAKH